MSKPEKGVMRLKQRQRAVENMAKRLFTAERAIDEAISKMADLMGCMPIVRTNAHLPATVSRDAISAAAECLSALIGASGNLVATHNWLAETRDQIGLRSVSLESGNMKPSALSETQDEIVVIMVDHGA